MILPVTDTGIRPAGRPDRCFYCQVPAEAGKPTDHKADCVCRGRTVAVELKTWLVVEVPAAWDEEQIRFHLNDSSHCAGNEIGQLAEEENRVEGECCSCFRTEMKFLREATADDQARTRWKSPDDEETERRARAEELVEKYSREMFTGGAGEGTRLSLARFARWLDGRV